MKINILIAEARDIPRMGLRTIFSADERVKELYEATNEQELQHLLQYEAIDLIIINQALVSSSSNLPRDQFVIITPVFDFHTFLLAYKYGARGYLLDTSSVEILRTILNLSPNTFLLEPSFTPQVIDHLTQDARFAVKEELLTPREKEIVELLREGVGRQEIARQLNISYATLKTHIKNIFKKREQEV